MSNFVPCPECGNAPVSHRYHFFSAYMSQLMRRSQAPVYYIWSKLAPFIGVFFFNTLGIFTLRTLHVIGFAEKLSHPDEKNSYRSRVIWQEALRRGITMHEYRPFGHPCELFIASHYLRHHDGVIDSITICFSSLPRPLYTDKRIPTWMDSKDVMREKFEKAGIPIARGGIARNFEEAKALFLKLEKPVITKPHVGSRSRHTTTHITSLSELMHGYDVAHVLSPRVIVEEELHGTVYRATAIGGRVVAVLRRDPPFVIGNGIDTLEKLIERENSHRQEKNESMQEKHIFHEIEVNKDVMAEIKRQGYVLSSIPKNLVRVLLHQKVGRGQGGTNTNVTSITHPKILSVLGRAATVVGDPIIGFDFIIEDIERPWIEQKHAGILECNGLPFIDLHHYPYNGEPVNVAGKVWDLIFPK